MRKRWYLILPIVVFIVSCSDLAFTIYFNKTCSHFKEANPVALYVLDNHGTIGLITFKMIVTLVSCSCMGFVLHNKKRPWRVAVSIFGLMGCTFIIGWWIFWIFI